VAGEAFETTQIALNVEPFQLVPGDPYRYTNFEGIGNLNQAFLLASLPDDDVVIRIEG